MRRMLLLLTVMVFAGCKSKMDPAKCKARLDELERTATRELRLGDFLADLGSRVRAAKATLPIVKNADPAPLEPGFVIWADSDPDAFSTAITEEACRTTGRTIYLLADASIPADMLSERAAWLASAAKSWSVELRVRQVVKLPAEREYTPWPDGTSDEVKKWANDALTGDDIDAKMAKIKPRILKTEKGCDDAIKKRTEDSLESAGDDLHLAWIHGLRDCNCSVDNLDETIAVHHIFEVTSTDLASIPIAPGTTKRVVPVLHCGDRKPFVLRVREAWQTRPPELDNLLAELTARIEECAQQNPEERGEQYELSVYPSSLADKKELDIDFHRLAFGTRTGLEECMRRGGTDLAAPAEGELHADWYVPAMPKTQTRPPTR